MKLDYDKFKGVLDHISKNPKCFGRQVIIEGYDNAEINRYLGLLLDNGLIEANRFSMKGPGIVYFPTRITMKGELFIDGTEDPHEWGKLKKTVSHLVTIVGIAELIKFVCESVNG